MAEFGEEDLSGSTFDWTDLSGSTFRAASLSNAGRITGGRRVAAAPRHDGHCLSIVLNEEWWHGTYAARDLTVLEERPDQPH